MTVGLGVAEPLPRRGVAPDVIHIGDRYFLYIAANSGPTKAEINLLTNKTLDPDSPDYKWEESGVSVIRWVEAVWRLIPVSSSIRLPVSCGSHTALLWLYPIGGARPENGASVSTQRKARNIAINSEASIMIYHDGWYYLLVTHGSCCRGARLGLRHSCRSCEE
jgi:arabinan endo-1,5-alpha-L-arabinosidase